MQNCYPVDSPKATRTLRLLSLCCLALVVRSSNPTGAFSFRKLKGKASSSSSSSSALKLSAEQRRRLLQVDGPFQASASAIPQKAAPPTGGRPKPPQHENQLLVDGDTTKRAVVTTKKPYSSLFNNMPPRSATKLVTPDAKGPPRQPDDQVMWQGTHFYKDSGAAADRKVNGMTQPKPLLPVDNHNKTMSTRGDSPRPRVPLAEDSKSEKYFNKSARKVLWQGTHFVKDSTPSGTNPPRGNMSTNQKIPIQAKTANQFFYNPVSEPGAKLEDRDFSTGKPKVPVKHKTSSSFFVDSRFGAGANGFRSLMPQPKQPQPPQSPPPQESLPTETASSSASSPTHEQLFPPPGSSTARWGKSFAPNKASWKSPSSKKASNSTYLSSIASKAANSFAPGSAARWKNGAVPVNNTYVGSLNGKAPVSNGYTAPPEATVAPEPIKEEPRSSMPASPPPQASSPRKNSFAPAASWKNKPPPKNSTYMGSLNTRGGAFAYGPGKASWKSKPPVADKSYAGSLGSAPAAPAPAPVQEGPSSPAMTPPSSFSPMKPASFGPKATWKSKPPVADKSYAGSLGSSPAPAPVHEEAKPAPAPPVMSSPSSFSSMMKQSSFGPKANWKKKSPKADNSYMGSLGGKKSYGPGGASWKTKTITNTTYTGSLNLPRSAPPPEPVQEETPVVPVAAAAPLKKSYKPNASWKTGAPKTNSTYLGALAGGGASAPSQPATETTSTVTNDMYSVAPPASRGSGARSSYAPGRSSWKDKVASITNSSYLGSLNRW